MGTTNQEQPQPLIDILLNLIEFTLAVLSRPVVQNQVLVILLILLVTWLLPKGVRRWWQQRNSAGRAFFRQSISHDRRWLQALSRLLEPVLALILLKIAIWLFAQLGYPNGLLKDLTNLIWLWLIYRVIQALLLGRYGEAYRPYQNRIVTPVLVVLVISQILETVPGTQTLVDATISFGTITISFGDLITAIFVIYLSIIVAWVVKEIMMHSLPGRLNTETGVIESIAALTSYALLTIGILLSLSILGLNFTSLAIIAGGLSVGIGIGLQDLVANFVSGLVLLFEQSLRPGDVIELDGRVSQVEKISLRATIVSTRTNEELIIPNSKFTTDQVKNLTRTDRMIVVTIPFGVSYSSDPELVRRVAVKTALSHPLALADPPPSLRFQGYGESSLDFILWVSVNRPELSLQIRSDFYYMLWNAFDEHDVEVPFPQRDLNLGDGWEKLTTIT